LWKKKKEKEEMNIKVPAGSKSPTVVIIGGGTMSGDEKANKLHEKRMDLLEKKINQRYKTVSDGISSNEIKSIQKTFISRLDKMINLNNQNISKQNDKLISAIKDTISKKVASIKASSDNGDMEKFLSKIDSLEDAIRKISLKERVVNVTKKVSIDSSFEKLFAKLQKAIQDVKPRMYPSPS
jgi:hypothetical protein